MRLRSYSFLIDGVSGQRLPAFYRALAQAAQLTKADFNKETRVLNVEAAWDPEPSIRLICQVVGAEYRVSKKKNLMTNDAPPAVS